MKKVNSSFIRYGGYAMDAMDLPVDLPVHVDSTIPKKDPLNQLEDKIFNFDGRLLPKKILDKKMTSFWQEIVMPIRWWYNQLTATDQQKNEIKKALSDYRFDTKCKKKFKGDYLKIYKGISKDELKKALDEKTKKRNDLLQTVIQSEEETSEFYKLNIEIAVIKGELVRASIFLPSKLNSSISKNKKMAIAKANVDRLRDSTQNFEKLYAPDTQQDTYYTRMPGDRRISRQNDSYLVHGKFIAKGTYKKTYDLTSISIPKDRRKIDEFVIDDKLVRYYFNKKFKKETLAAIQKHKELTDSLDCPYIQRAPRALDEAGKIYIDERYDSDLYEEIHKGTLSIDDKLSINHNISEAVKVLKSNSLVHGDLKTDNILLKKQLNEGAQSSKNPQFIGVLSDFDFIHDINDKKAEYNFCCGRAHEDSFVSNSDVVGLAIALSTSLFQRDFFFGKTQDSCIQLRKDFIRSASYELIIGLLEKQNRSHIISCGERDELTIRNINKLKASKEKVEMSIKLIKDVLNRDLNKEEFTINEYMDRLEKIQNSG